MTTLVYRSGTLAADSRTTTGGTIDPGYAVKVRRLRDGRLVGFTGHTAQASSFVRWLEAGATDEQPTLSDSRVVVVTPTGAVSVFEDASFYEAEGSDFYAWGSGAAPALGALYVGADAAQAVEAASRVDPGTGGAVQVVSL
jgi:hypothetical protein